MIGAGSTCVWLGRGTGRIEFLRLLEYRVEGMGDDSFVPSQFGRAIGINKYDPLQLGGDYLPKEVRVGLLMRQFEHVAQVENLVGSDRRANCYVMFFDADKPPESAPFSIGEFSFEYVGTFPCQ